MDINVKVTIGAEPELIMHLATLTECVKDVLKASKGETTIGLAPEPPKPEPAKKKAKPAEKKPDPVKEDYDTLKAAPAPAAEPKEDPRDMPPAPAPAPEPAPAKEEAPAVTEADIRALCVELVKKDPANKKKIAAVFKSFGATKLPEVKPEDYQKVMDQLK